MSSVRSMLFATFSFVVSLFVSATAIAADFEKAPFDKAVFDQLQQEGTPVLIDVFATWCPTCKKQQQVIGEYFAENPDSEIKVLVIDYDTQSEWVKHFKAPRQSTLYLYKNNEQLWFSVAETRKEKIFSALNSGG